MATDDLTLDRLILWHRQQAILCKQSSIAAVTSEGRATFTSLFETHDATAEFLEELASRRKEEDSEDD